MEVVLAPKFQLLSSFDFQIPNEGSEPETKFELRKYKSVPLTFNSFQFLKETLEYVQKDKHLENQEISLEPIQQSFQFIHDPIDDVLDDLCFQIHVSFSSYGLKSIYDLDMIRQSVSWFVSMGASFQSSSEKL
jgi:hypothetical protein